MRTWIRILIFGTLACVLLACGGAWLFKFRVTEFNVSSTVVFLGFGLSVIFGVLSIGTLFVRMVRKQSYGLFTVFLAFVICFCLAGYAAVAYNKSVTYPFAHNISTDLIDPPMFSEKVLNNRGERANPVMLDERKRKLHEGAYDDLQPLVVDTNRSLTYSAALELVGDRGWELVRQDANAGEIEATATTFWFGFKDDIAIRIRANADNMNKTTVDLHSVSRIGQTDLGANAQRIRDFLVDLNDRLSNGTNASP